MNTKTSALRSSLSSGTLVRVVGASDGMSALLAERNGFDAIWSSGLAISTSHGVPDAGLLSMKEILDAASVINQATSLPVIADCDTGFGDVNVVMRMVRQFEAAGIAAVCIEDKCFPKRNSFRDGHRLADVCEFSAKLCAATSVRTDPDFLVIARLESFIAGESLAQALRRADAYVSAGADALLVHSKAATPDEVESFAAAWRAEGRPQPLVVVPTTYGGVTCERLEQVGINGVIYANHAMRAALRAMDDVLARIRSAGTSSVVEDDIASLDEAFALTQTARVEAVDAWFDAVTRARGRIALAPDGSLPDPPLPDESQPNGSLPDGSLAGEPA